jgi:hypothetical protein
MQQQVEPAVNTRIFEILASDTKITPCLKSTKLIKITTWENTQNAEKA